MEMICHLHPDVFALIEKGDKDVEVRLNDEKRQRLKIGDKIIFLKRPLEEEKIEAIVTDLKHFNNFSEVVEYYEMKRIHKPELSKEEYIKDMERFYSLEEQSQLGVLGIEYKKV